MNEFSALLRDCIYPVIYDENGDKVPAGSGKAGNICIRNPWPGIFQTI